ncbi:MAG: hypothetical protein ACREDR_11080 [Blastocatellia bacterium]
MIHDQLPKLNLPNSLLYNVPPIDGVTLCAVSALLATVAGAAALIPARRAMTVDPLVALRYQ